LRQWQYLVWQVASITTLSAALPVQAQASWLQKCLGQTAQVLSSLVPPLAYCATMQEFAAALTSREKNQRKYKYSRRQGDALAAVF
jgi:hypothetical protein